MEGLECAKCKKIFFDEQQRELELHHLIPKFMGGKDLDGRIYLCVKCHDILHHLLSLWIFNKFVYPVKKEECKRKIKELSLWWIKK